MWAGILAICKAIPGLLSLGLMIRDGYEKYRDNKIDAHYEAKAQRRTRLLNDMQEESAKPAGVRDEEYIKALHRKLHNLDSTPGV